MLTKLHNLTRFASDDTTREDLMRPWFSQGQDGKTVIYATNGHCLAEVSVVHPNAKAFEGYYVPKAFEAALKIKGCVDVMLYLSGGQWRVEATDKNVKTLATMTEPAERADKVPQVTQVMPKPEEQTDNPVGFSGAYLADIAAHHKLLGGDKGLEVHPAKSVLGPAEFRSVAASGELLRVWLMPMRVGKGDRPLVKDLSDDLAARDKQVDKLKLLNLALESEIRDLRQTITDLRQELSTLLQSSAG